MEKNIGEVIKNGVAGVLKGTREAAVGIVDVVSATIVEALEGVKDVQTAAGSVVVGATSIVVEAAETIGGEAGSAIKKAVTGTISGIKVVVKGPFKKEK